MQICGHKPPCQSPRFQRQVTEAELANLKHFFRQPPFPFGEESAQRLIGWSANPETALGMDVVVFDHNNWWITLLRKLPWVSPVTGNDKQRFDEAIVRLTAALGTEGAEAMPRDLKQVILHRFPNPRGAREALPQIEADCRRMQSHLNAQAMLGPSDSEVTVVLRIPVSPTP